MVATVRVVRRRLAYAVGSALVVALAGGVAGCSSDPNSVAEQAKAGDQKGYISGDGSVEKVGVSDRKGPVKLSGATIDGGTWSMPTGGDTVVVVNVWASWCPPCVAEAPHLESVWKGYQDAGANVAFVGIDTRDNAGSASAFARKVGLTYPSLDDPSGVAILSLQGKAPSVPTTLVLDRAGRIAARISGATTEATLKGLVDDVLAES